MCVCGLGHKRWFCTLRKERKESQCRDRINKTWNTSKPFSVRNRKENTLLNYIKLHIHKKSETLNECNTDFVFTECWNTFWTLCCSYFTCLTLRELDEIQHLSLKYFFRTEQNNNACYLLVSEQNQNFLIWLPIIIWWKHTHTRQTQKEQRHYRYLACVLLLKWCVEGPLGYFPKDIKGN